MHALVSVLAILFGCVFTVMTAWALGALLFRRLPLAVFGWEERLLAFVVGSACLSAIVFLLCAARIAWKAIFLVLGLAVIGYALRTGLHRSKVSPFPPLPRAWLWICAAVFLVFGGFYFLQAMSPETSPDGMAYHLGVIVKYQRAHGFVPITTDIYASLSEGIELLFLFAFEFGRHSSAALVHFCFLLCLTFLILNYGRRIGRPGAGAAAAMLVFASPIVGLDGSIAYIDDALATVIFALFYLLQIWAAEMNARFLIPIGILAGFSYAVKYTAGLAVPYALIFVIWKLRKAGKPVLRPAAAISGLALVFIVPWMLKNWIVVANPVSPFANRLFPNPYVHVSFEEYYRTFLSTYGLTSRWQVPWQITVRGDVTQGFFGPVFLLAPLGLLALRWREGRALLLAGAVFSLTYWGNVGTRFLIPALPFFSLSLAIALAGTGWLLMLLVLAHAISCWPSVAKHYCARYAWRLDTVSPKAALRIEPEAKYLERNHEYNVARLVERVVPPGEKVFTFSQPGESYITRELLLCYEAAFNEVLGDILLTPIIPDWQPHLLRKFQFPARELQRVRVVQTANLPDKQWSVTEIRLFAAGKELPRDPQWRLTAHPNRWDVQMAFDNSPVTRWRTWQPAEPGMFLEINLGRPQAVDAVLVEMSSDAQAAQLRVEGLGSDGKWTRIADRSDEVRRPVHANLRNAATAELKARGIGYILMDGSEAGADDMRSYTALWGMKCIGEFEKARVYRIQ